MSAMLSNTSLHRRIVQVGALLFMAAACFMICAPLLIPALPVMPSILWFSVPLSHQRTVCAVAGLACLIEGIALFLFLPAGWWVAMVLCPLGLLHSILNATRFYHVPLDALILCYLYLNRGLFIPELTPRSAKKADQ